MSDKERILTSIRESVVGLDSDGVQEAVEQALSCGISPIEILRDGIFKGLGIIGERFERREYFLPELMVSGEITKDALHLLKPYTEDERVVSTGKIVVGTVEGDVHDIGKNIVAMFLESRGFEVIDLGVDVSPRDFVEAVKEHCPQILGMSALLTHTMPMIGEVIKRLKESGLREKVKIVIGGAPITSSFAERVGADYAAKGALDGVEKCLEWSRKEAER